MVDADKMVQLFHEWQAKAIHAGSVFNLDGIVDPAEWAKQEKHILFVLKEAYHSDEYPSPVYDLTQDLRDYAPWKGDTVWRRVAEWANGILLSGPDSMESYRKLSDAEANAVLRRIAIVNIKKSHGTPQSDPDDLRHFAEADKELLYRQIELIEPDIIVCGNTFEFLNIVIGTHDTPIDREGQHSDNWHYRWRDRMILDYYHPAALYPAQLLYYGLLGCYRDALI